jgi:hypothetical protein
MALTCLICVFLGCCFSVIIFGDNIALAYNNTSIIDRKIEKQSQV